MPQLDGRNRSKDMQFGTVEPDSTDEEVTRKNPDVPADKNVDIPPDDAVSDDEDDDSVFPRDDTVYPEFDLIQ